MTKVMFLIGIFAGCLIIAVSSAHANPPRDPHIQCAGFLGHIGQKSGIMCFQTGWDYYYGTTTVYRPFLP